MSVSRATGAARTADPGARAGGLAVAVWESLKSTGGVWFGWSGDIVETPTRSLHTLKDDGVEFVLTDLSQEEHDQYYLHYANSVLWPVFHYRIDLASFDSDAFQVYVSVNQRIANMVADRLRAGDSVWVHDYHFLLMGDSLRRAGWDGPIGFFLHIPFPPPEVFRALPDHLWIARAKQQVASVVGACELCQRYKFAGPGYGMLPPRNVSSQPREEVTVNLVGQWSVKLAIGVVRIFALTIIDTASNLPECVRLENKTSQQVTLQFTNRLFMKPPRYLETTRRWLEWPAMFISETQMDY